MKHTKGEWSFTRSDKHFHIIEYLDAYGLPNELAKTHIMVDKERSEANAKLIASAPELLKIARLMRGELLRLIMNNEDVRLTAEQTIEIDQAINKATN